MLGRGQHRDICTCREHTVLRGRDDDGPHLRMFESEALHGIVQLDVDAEVVGVEFQLVPGSNSCFLVDIQRQRGNPAVNFHPPVLVAIRLRFEGDDRMLRCCRGLVVH